MATNNSNNNQYTNNADGFSLAGGTTQRTLTATGSNITLTGAGSNTYTMPAATDTLVGRASTDTLTNKTIDATGTGNSISNVSNLSVKRQNITSNTTATGAHIETGWGYILGNSASQMTQTITFNSTFSNAPIVTMSFAGYNTSIPTTINGNLQDNNGYVIMPQGISTSGFTANFFKTSGTFLNTAYYIYTWIAIGA